MIALVCPRHETGFTVLRGTDDYAADWPNGIDTAATQFQRRWPLPHVLYNRTIPEVPSEGNEWIEKTIPALLRVAEMADNWDAEGSPGTDRAIVETVRNLLARLRDSDLGAVPVPFVCPVSGGGLQLEWTSPQRHLEIELIDQHTGVYLKEETSKGEATETGEYPIVETERTRQLLDWFAAV